MAQRNAAEVITGAAVLLVAAGFLFYAVAATGRGGGSGGYTLHAAFENIGGISTGADVRVAGLKVGTVTGLAVDEKSYQAVATFTVQNNIKLPSDSSASIATGGLLGGNFIALAPGGDDKLLTDGQAVTITTSAANLEDLLGKFIFNVGNLAEASQKQLQRDQKPDAGK